MTYSVVPYRLRDRTRIERIKPGASTRARHASLGSGTGSFPVSLISYESLPKSPAVSFLASFAEQTLAALPAINHLGAEGDQIGNYILGRQLDRGAFSSVMEAWTTDPGGVGEDGFRHVAVKVLPKESGGGSPVVGALAASVPFHQASTMSTMPSVGSAADFGSLGSNVGMGISFAGPQRNPSPALAPYGRDMSDPELSQDNLDREIAIWQRLRHPNIVRMLEVLDTEAATYIVCEFADGGSLFQLLQKHPQGLPEKVAWAIFKQVAEGVRYLHEDVAVCHGDLKLENVLLSTTPHVDGVGAREPHSDAPTIALEKIADLESETYLRVQVKIMDFGLSEYIGSPVPLRSEAGHLAGTLPYLAPEMLKRGASNSPRSSGGSQVDSFQERHGPLTKAASQPDFAHMPGLAAAQAAAGSPGGTLPVISGSQDIWASAVILFALLTGNLPFQDDFAPRLQMKIMRGMYDESLLGKRSVSLGARDVIKKCLQVKENERWTIRQLVDSTWLQQGPAELLMGKGTARAPETP